MFFSGDEDYGDEITSGIFLEDGHGTEEAYRCKNCGLVDVECDCLEFNPGDVD